MLLDEVSLCHIAFTVNNVHSTAHLLCNYHHRKPGYFVHVRTLVSK